MKLILNACEVQNGLETEYSLIAHVQCTMGGPGRNKQLKDKSRFFLGFFEDPV